MTGFLYRNDATVPLLIDGNISRSRLLLVGNGDVKEDVCLTFPTLDDFRTSYGDDYYRKVSRLIEDIASDRTMPTIKVLKDDAHFAIWYPLRSHPQASAW